MEGVKRTRTILSIELSAEEAEVLVDMLTRAVADPIFTLDKMRTGQRMISLLTTLLAGAGK